MNGLITKCVGLWVEEMWLNSNKCGKRGLSGLAESLI